MLGGTHSVGEKHQGLKRTESDSAEMKFDAMDWRTTSMSEDRVSHEEYGAETNKVTGCTSRIDIEVITHHKAGCVMSRRAKEFITRSCNKWHVNVNCAQDISDFGGGRAGGKMPGTIG